jgi:hypothetical protein
MTHIFTKLFLHLLFIGSISPIFAQNIIWSEDFGGGIIPNGWTNIDASGQLSTVWQWETGGVYFAGQPTFAAPTANNGFVIFDSDNAGTLNTNHDVRLTTNAINCANKSTVIAKFSNQYSYFNPTAKAYLGVSNNGTNFIYFPILTTVQNSDLTASEQVEELDISSVAANQANIYLQFRWVGNYEYTWRIDDIKLQDAMTQIPANNTAISYYLIPNAYQMPITQIDTFFFHAQIDNLGTNDQTNVQLTAQITDFNNQIIFTETANINTISANTTGTEVIFNTHFPPSTNWQTGNYTLSYILTQDSIDAVPTDNRVDFDFIISDTTFALDNGNFNSVFSGGSSPINGAGAYGIANYYYIPKDSSKASSVTFSIYNPSNIIGETIDIFLFQADVNNDSNLDENGDGIVNSNDFGNSLKGFAQYKFIGIESSNELITVPLENFSATGEEILLNGNGSYIVMLEYTGNKLMLITGAEATPYTNLNTIGINTVTDFWSLGGLPNGILAVLRLNIQQLGVPTKPIFNDNNFQIFPNPTTNFLNIITNFETTINDLRITLTDMNGKIILRDKQSNIQQKTIQYDIKNLPTGIYLLTITTEKEQITKKIIIE